MITPEELAPILSKLVAKMGARLRQAHFQAKGVHLGLTYRNHTYWHRSLTLDQFLFASEALYHIAYQLLLQSPCQVPVRNIAVSCFSLSSSHALQLGLFQDHLRQEKLVSAIDEINDRWGDFVVSPGTMVNTESLVRKSIGFGNLRST